MTPNTASAYRFTSFTGTGPVGIGTVAWTSPSPAAIRWLPATVSGSTVTLMFRAIVSYGGSLVGGQTGWRIPEMGELTAETTGGVP